MGKLEGKRSFSRPMSRKEDRISKLILKKWAYDSGACTAFK